MRRTCLTLLTRADVSDSDVKAIAGHAKGDVTRGHYVGNILERLYRAVLRMPVGWTPPKGKKATKKEGRDE